MNKPFKKDTINENIENIIKPKTKDIMSKRNSPNKQGKADSSKNNSSKVTVDSESAKEKQYLVIDADNKHESKIYQDFDPKMQEIIELFEDKDVLYNQLVDYAYDRLSSMNNNGRYTIESEDLVYEIIEKLMNGKLQWDMNKFPSPFEQVKYHIFWKTKKLYEKDEKMNGEREINDFTSKDIFRDELYQMDDADFDVKGDYQNLNEEELKEHNQTIHVDEWYAKKANPFQKKVIDLKRAGLKDQEIAAKLKAPVKKVYNVLKNNKSKFKDLQY